MHTGTYMEHVQLYVFGSNAYEYNVHKDRLASSADHDFEIRMIESTYPRWWRRQWQNCSFMMFLLLVTTPVLLNEYSYLRIPTPTVIQLDNSICSSNGQVVPVIERRLRKT